MKVKDLLMETLDKYIPKDRFRCRYCGRVFDMEKALNIHITKSHVQKEEDATHLYHGEGLLEVKSEGTFVDLRIRIKIDLWRSLKRFALLNGVTPEEVVIASLVNLKLPEDTEKLGYYG